MSSHSTTACWPFPCSCLCRGWGVCPPVVNRHDTNAPVTVYVCRLMITASTSKSCTASEPAMQSPSTKCDRQLHLPGSSARLTVSSTQQKSHQAQRPTLAAAAAAGGSSGIGGAGRTPTATTTTAHITTRTTTTTMGLRMRGQIRWSSVWSAQS
jgi:hypothetical protein